jgi:hypothetical protein
LHSIFINELLFTIPLTQFSNKCVVFQTTHIIYCVCVWMFEIKNMNNTLAYYIIFGCFCIFTKWNKFWSRPCTHQHKILFIFFVNIIYERTEHSFKNQENSWQFIDLTKFNFSNTISNVDMNNNLFMYVFLYLIHWTLKMFILNLESISKWIHTKFAMQFTR